MNYSEKINSLLNTLYKKFKKMPKTYLVYGFFIFFSFLIIIELFSFTIINHRYYKKLADDQHISQVKLPSNRGTIYSWDQEETILATSVDLNDLAVDPSIEWDKQKLSNFLTDIVFNETCYLESTQNCRDNLIKFLKVTSLDDFKNKESYIKSKIYENILEKVNRTKVTSVLLTDNLTNEQAFELERLKLRWVYVNGNNLYVNPEEINEDDLINQKISDIILWDLWQVSHLTRKRKLRYTVIFRKLSVYSSEQIKKRIKEENEQKIRWNNDVNNYVWQFIILTPNGHRLYPENTMASQIIGFVDNSGVWKYGLEWYFDEILKWSQEDNLSITDIQWRIIEPLDTKRSKDTAWASITTTIDRNIQKAVEDIIDQDADTFEANQISVLITDPKTWAVLAMATNPRYDLNNPGNAYELEKITPDKYPDPSVNLRWKRVMAVDSKNWLEFYYNWNKILLREADEEELSNWDIEKYVFKNGQWSGVYTNHLIQDVYEPGSVFKPILMAAWIDSWEIKKDDMYQDNGYIKIWPYTIKNVSDKCLWYNTFQNAMDFSCNVWMIRIAQKLWKALYYRYLVNFWFWEKTWITLSWELKWSLSHYDTWSDAQLLTTSYWLWVWVTMAQMGQAYWALANWGIIYKPQIVKEIQFAAGKKITYKSEAIRRSISDQTSKTMTEVLVHWVENWAAQTWKVEWYSLAWKTWTAQIASKWWYEEWFWSTIASYAWYGPTESPKFVIIVRVDRPRASEWWGQTAWKTFQRIATFLLKYYKIPPKE